MVHFFSSFFIKDALNFSAEVENFSGEVEEGEDVLCYSFSQGDEKNVL